MHRFFFLRTTLFKQVMARESPMCNIAFKRQRLGKNVTPRAISAESVLHTLSRHFVLLAQCYRICPCLAAVKLNTHVPGLFLDCCLLILFDRLAHTLDASSGAGFYPKILQAFLN